MYILAFLHHFARRRSYLPTVTDVVNFESDMKKHRSHDDCGVIFPSTVRPLGLGLVIHGVHVLNQIHNLVGVAPLVSLQCI